MAIYSRGEREGLGCCRACPTEALAAASEHGGHGDVGVLE